MTKLELILKNKKELSSFSFARFCLQFILNDCKFVMQDGKLGYEFENEFYSIDLLLIIYKEIKIQNNFVKRNIRKIFNFFRKHYGQRTDKTVSIFNRQ